MDALTKRRERQRKFLEMYHSEGGEEKIDAMYDRVFTKIVYHIRKMKKYGRASENIRFLRHLVPIYRDLMYSGIYEFDTEHRKFLHFLEEVIHSSPETKRTAKAIARLSK